MPNFTQEIAVEQVSYGRGEISVRTQSRFRASDGKVFSDGVPSYVTIPEAKAAEVATAAGRTEWGNADIETLLRAATKMTRAAIPEIPAIPPVRDPSGAVLRDEVPAVPAREAEYAQLIPADVAIVWPDA